MFVIEPVDRGSYGAAARRIMTAESVGAEQVGYIMPSQRSGIQFRMEMMGGEFCGNASRSFAAWQILRNSLAGGKRPPTQGELLLDVSGCSQPLPARYHTTEQAHCLYVACDMPLPFRIIHGSDPILADYSLVAYDGITHVVLWEHAPAEGDLAKVQALIKSNLCDPNSCGVMYYDNKAEAIRPLVHIEASGTTVWETSCGSGSCAVAAAMAQRYNVSEATYQLKQPGGTLTVEVIQEKGRLRSLTLGGPISITATGILYMEDDMP